MNHGSSTHITLHPAAPCYLVKPYSGNSSVCQYASVLYASVTERDTLSDTMGAIPGLEIVRLAPLCRGKLLKT